MIVKKREVHRLTLALVVFARRLAAVDNGWVARRPSSLLAILTGFRRATAELTVR